MTRSCGAVATALPQAMTPIIAMPRTQYKTRDVIDVSAARLDHSHSAAASTRPTKPANHGVGSAKIAARITMARMIAVITRCLSTARHLKPGFGRQIVLADHQPATEAALAGGKGRNGALQIGFAEVGPVGIAEIQLGVGNLPQQEIADALLASGTDQQIRPGEIAERNISVEGIFIDLFGAKFTAR